MSILAANGPGGHDGNSKNSPDFSLDRNDVNKYLLDRDDTGALFASLSFMDGVEGWVLQRLGTDDESRVEVSARLRRLSEIIYQYREQIPPDNHAFLQVISWLNVSVVVYVLDYLCAHQSDFMSQLMTYCRNNEGDDINAALMVKRVRALYRARLLDRIYAPENVEFVMRVLLKEVQ